MPTIIGSKSGTRPHLELDWSVTSQDVANNRSRVNLRLFLKVDYSIQYSARYTGTLYGASFTSSSGYISRPGRYLLTERNVWINHNSDGTKTERLTADYNLNITWGGVYHGKISLSGNANLGTIPRASTLSAFSFASHLQPSTSVTINYTVDRKSSNFRHQIQLRDGSHIVQTWDNISSNGASAVTLSTASVNSLLNRMSSVTTRSLTLRVATRSGSGGSWIGSAVTRNATATVSANVKPSVGALSLSQTGNSVSSHYLQGKSKVKAEFTRSAGYGASISSSSITIRRKGNNDDVQTINSNSGTTGRAVSLSGAYEAQGMARDSRGRTTYTAWTDFTVTAYSAPRITNFTAVRSSSNETTIVVTRNGTHTSLGRANSARMLIQKRTGTGAWTTVQDTSDAGGTWSGSVNSTGNSVTSSYDFRATLTDAFGETATATVTVSTQRVVLDIHKNEGVGIGKIHEQGALDVDGDIYSNGVLHTLGGIGSIEIPAGADLNDYVDNGFYHTRFSAHAETMTNVPTNEAFSLLVETHAGRKQTFTRYDSNHPRTWVRNMYSGVWGRWSEIPLAIVEISGDFNIIESDISSFRAWRYGSHLVTIRFNYKPKTGWQNGIITTTKWKPPFSIALAVAHGSYRDNANQTHIQIYENGQVTSYTPTAYSNSVVVSGTYLIK